MLVGWARTQGMVFRIGKKIEALNFVIEDPAARERGNDMLGEY